MSRAILQVGVAAVLPCSVCTLWSQEQERRKVAHTLFLHLLFSVVQSIKWQRKQKWALNLGHYH